jgi:putative transposase
MRKTVFAEKEIYHIYNRGTDKRAVFLDDFDRYRFIRDLQSMNSPEPSANSGYYFARSPYIYSRSGYCGNSDESGNNKCLVDILAFVLMPNHYHLLVSQRANGGIASFMQKLGTAYTMYFNMKYQRSGVLFQGPFKSILVKTQNHYGEIPYYIHANPLKLAAQLPSVALEIAFLSSYKWSSFRDYAGISELPSFLNKTILDAFFCQEGGLSGMTTYLKKRRECAIEARPH